MGDYRLTSSVTEMIMISIKMAFARTTSPTQQTNYVL